MRHQGLSFISFGRAWVLGESLIGGLKRLPTMRETRVQCLGREDLLEKAMATHSSIHAWKIPWTEEPVGYSLWGRSFCSLAIMLKTYMYYCGLEDAVQELAYFWHCLSDKLETTGIISRHDTRYSSSFCNFNCMPLTYYLDFPLLPSSTMLWCDILLPSTLIPPFLTFNLSFKSATDPSHHAPRLWLVVSYLLCGLAMTVMCLLLGTCEYIIFPSILSQQTCQFQHECY